jgi:hypothetical protein
MIVMWAVIAIFGLICFCWGHSAGHDRGYDKGYFKGWNDCYIHNFDSQPKMQGVKGMKNS